jgi:hypothetical protein
VAFIAIGNVVQSLKSQVIAKIKILCSMQCCCCLLMILHTLKLTLSAPRVPYLLLIAYRGSSLDVTRGWGCRSWQRTVASMGQGGWRRCGQGGCHILMPALPLAAALAFHSGMESQAVHTGPTLRRRSEFGQLAQKLVVSS